MSVPVTIVGNLTADVELKFTPQGKAVSKFSVATAERFKTPEGNWDSKNTTFWNIIVWDKQAENVADTGRHGHQLRGAEHPMAKLDADAVKVIRGSSKSGPELARLFAVTSAHICSVRHSRCWKHVV